MKKYELDYAKEWNVECSDLTRAINAIWSTDHEVTIEEFKKSGEDFTKAVLSPYITQDSLCVDIGCGIGRLTLPLAQRAKAVIGIDISPEMINLAKQYCSEPNATFLCSDYAYPIKDGSIDLVVSHLVLQHMELPDMICVINEAHRILKKYGWFVASFANLLHTGHQNAIIMEMMGNTTLRASHVRGYTPETAMLLFNKIGFATKISELDQPTFFVKAIKVW